MRLARAILVAAASTGVGLAAASAPGAPSPGARYAAALAAARGERSVHYVARSRQGPVVVTYTGDVAASRGIQRITFVQDGTRNRMTALVVGHRAWVRGSAGALVRVMGTPRALAETYAGRWIVVPAAHYAAVAADVTLPSVLADLRLEGAVRASAPQRIAGRQAIGLSGRAPGSSRRVTVFVPVSGVPLPLASTEVDAYATSNLTFSRWNEAVRVVAPAHALVVQGKPVPTGPVVPA